MQIYIYKLYCTYEIYIICKQAFLKVALINRELMQNFTFEYAYLFIFYVHTVIKKNENLKKI